MQTVRSTAFQAFPNREQEAMLNRIAGACRFVWNQSLRDNKYHYAGWKIGANAKPSTSYFSLTKDLTEMRKRYVWMNDLPSVILRSSMKRLSLAWDRKWKGIGSFPKPKKKHGKNQGFDIPERVLVKDGKIFVPKTGWIRISRRGKNAYESWKPVKTTFTRDKFDGKWKVTVFYKGEMEEKIDDGTVVGLDRNVHQSTSSEGIIYHLPVERLKKIEQRRKRWERIASRRKGARKGETCSNRRRKALKRVVGYKRRAANTRKNWAHHVVNDLAKRNHTLVLENLNVMGMTKKATKNGHAKKTLNRLILESAWGHLKNISSYKAGKLVFVHPAYTSMTCNQCGVIDALNRKGSKFKCVECGNEDHADFNAGKNIVDRAIENGFVDPPTSLLGFHRVEVESERDSLNGCGRVVRLRKDDRKKHVREGILSLEASSIEKKVA